ncbi:MAG TPA: hypothetical protein VFX48_08225, partial [Saprospiraceae bacterium]|nr:hypothetical protein [Saprospiraceae bacterium]
MISFNHQLHLKTYHQLSDVSLEETTRDITIRVIRHEKGPYGHSIIGWYPLGEGFQKAKFKVALEKLPVQCHYGDRITGRFSIGPIYRWESRYFDAPNQYLRREHIYLEGRFKGDSLTILPAPGFNLFHQSQRIAHHLQLAILQSISEVEIAQLLTSLLIGIKTNLDQEIKQSFIRSGTAHILAVSG